MDLELTQEQALLAESVRQLLAQNQGPGVWPALVEFGALEIAAGEDVGAVELALVARELGERLEATPLIDTASAAYAARGSGLEAALADATVGLALLEPGGGWGLEEPAAAVTGGVVDGRKVAVGVDDADVLLVLADDGGARRLAVVPRGNGATAARIPWIDDSLAPVELTFDGAHASAVQPA